MDIETSDITDDQRELLKSLPERVGGEKLDLEAPKRLSWRIDLFYAQRQAAMSGQNQIILKVCAAALAMCWHRYQVKKGTPMYSNDVLEYGSRVVDHLVAPPFKVHPDEIIRLGSAALVINQIGLPIDEEVDKAEDFSDPQPVREP